jgi:hypothetical protein
MLTTRHRCSAFGLRDAKPTSPLRTPVAAISCAERPYSHALGVVDFHKSNVFALARSCHSRLFEKSLCSHWMAFGGGLFKRASCDSSMSQGRFRFPAGTLIGMYFVRLRYDLALPPAN